MELLNGVSRELKRLIEGYEATENHIGHSDCSVFYLTNQSKRALYLKVQSITTGNLRIEKERLEWLQGKLPVPELIYFESDNQNQYMLMSAIEGKPSFDEGFRHDIPNLVKQLAEGLKFIHSLDKTTCKFVCPINDRIKLVQDRVLSGNVDFEYLSRHYPNPNPQQLFDELVSLLPDVDELVVCHGDYSMPNVLLKDDHLSGFVDLGNLVVSDRYVDFVTVRDTFQYNKLPDECFSLFIEEYGIYDLDESKLHFYDLLNRFLG